MSAQPWQYGSSFQGDLTVAREHLVEGLAYARSINARRSISDGSLYLALVARQQGDLASALTHISQCLILDDELDDRLAQIDDRLVRASILIDLDNHTVLVKSCNAACTPLTAWVRFPKF